MIKSTNYCDVVMMAEVLNDATDYKINLEFIVVRELIQEELRFSYSKRTENGNFKMVARPLDITEDELFELLKEAMRVEVISQELRRRMKEIIKDTQLGVCSDTAIKDTDYCKIFCEGSVESENTKCSIENIFVKVLDRREIRFVYYSKNQKGNFQLVIRPLDVTEKEFIEMFRNAIQNGVFSKVFITALGTIL